MSDTVLVALIISITIIVILFIFRRQLSEFVFKAKKGSVEASLKTRKPQPNAKEGIDSGSAEQRAGVTIRRSKLIGKRNEIEVGRDDVLVEDNWLVGEEQKIDVKPDKKNTKKKK